MERTPVKVRGKLGNRIRHDLKRPGTSPGSRLSSPRSRSSSRATTPASAPGRNGRATVLSMFERLPNEILHRIFLFALNLDLPAVSLHLTQAFNGPGAHFLKLEYAFRTTYKPLSQLHVKWHMQGELISSNPRMLKLLSRADDDAKETVDSSPREGQEVPPDDEPLYHDAKTYLLRRLNLIRWKEYRQPDLQQRLINSRFFDWKFFIHLVRKAHPVFRKELSDAHALFELDKSKLSLKERWWIDVPTDELVDGMQDFPRAHDGTPNFRHYQRLPWLRFQWGVQLPARCVRGPWSHNKDSLLYWLVQGDCGCVSDPNVGINLLRVSHITMRLPTSMLVDAIRHRQEWIVNICIVRAKMPPTTEMLRQALKLEPFSFVIVQNLLFGAYPRHDFNPGVAGRTIDPLDPIVWSFIEEQEKREAAIANLIDDETGIGDCISVAKWLRHELRMVGEQPSDADFFIYLPLRPPMDNLMVEWAIDLRVCKVMGDVPHGAKLRDILISPDQ